MATLSMVRGDTPTFRVGPVQRLDENDVLQDVDLTGASGTMTVRDRLGGSVLFTVTAAFDVPNAYVLCQPADTDTADLDPSNSYVYDIQIEESDGTITTFPEKGHGKFRLRRGVTE